jgi:hypothetical protein
MPFSLELQFSDWAVTRELSYQNSICTHTHTRTHTHTHRLAVSVKFGICALEYMLHCESLTTVLFIYYYYYYYYYYY